MFVVMLMVVVAAPMHACINKCSSFSDEPTRCRCNKVFKWKFALRVFIIMDYGEGFVVFFEGINTSSAVCDE